MTDTPGRTARPSQPGGHDWYAPPSAGRVGAEDRLSWRLWLAVVVAGAGTFAVNAGWSEAFGSGVRMAVLAAVVAGVGLVRGQSSRGWVVVALAVVGALEVLSRGVEGAPGGWAAVAVTALNTVQAVVAVVALLVEPSSPDSTVVQDESDHAVYTRLVEAHERYAEVLVRRGDESEADSPAADATASGSVATSRRSTESAGGLAAYEQLYADALGGDWPSPATQSGAASARGPSGPVTARGVRGAQADGSRDGAAHGLVDPATP